MRLSLLAAACVLMPVFAHGAETRTFEGMGLTGLILQNTSGRVRIDGTDEGRAVVTARKITFGDHCRLTMERSGSRLEVVVEKIGFASGSCKVDFDIRVPRAVSLDLRSGSGDIALRGTRGAVEFKLGSGDFEADADIQRLDGKTGSGDVDVDGLNGDAEVKTGSGKVTLAYGEVPAKGRLDVKTGSGDITLYLPEGTPIRTKFRSGSGEFFNEIGDSQDAGFRITAKAGSGDLTIRKRR